MNGVIEIKVQENEQFLRILGIRGVPSDWLKVTINKGSVVTGP
jgi:hypothetical protein